MTSVVSAFTPDSCGGFIDLQLINNTFANAINTTFTLICEGSDPNLDQTNAPFTPCSTLPNTPWTTFCIGGVDQQHACSNAECSGCGPATCYGVDWTNSIASPCSSSILSVVKVQKAGIVPLCCDNTGCIVTSDGGYTCDADSDRSLLLCISDGNSAECLDTSASNSICSGNFTEDVAQPPSSNTNTGSVPLFGASSSTSQTAAVGGSSISQNADSSSASNSPGGSTVGLLSGSFTTSPSLSSSTTSSQSNSSSSSNSNSNSGSGSGSGLSASDKATIAGTIVGAVVSVAGCITGILKYKKKKRPKSIVPG